MNATAESKPEIRVFLGLSRQVRDVRAFVAEVAGVCPVSDDAVLLASEVATNAILHTASGKGGTFTVVVTREAAFLRVEVHDCGSDSAPGARLNLAPEESGSGFTWWRKSLLVGDASAGETAGSSGSRWNGSGRRRFREASANISSPNLRRESDDLIAVRCSCGFAGSADETMTDHLERILVPEDSRTGDGVIHEERETGTCACGFGVASPPGLDAHFLAVFTPADAIGSDGQRHAVEGHDDA